MKVNLGKDFVRIYDYESGEEVVGWQKDEWKEDPDIVPSIANTVLLSQNNPDELKRRLKER